MPFFPCSITVLECSDPVENVRYLRSDFRVECNGATYSVLAAAAAVSLVGVGLGFPLLIIIRLRGITAATLSKRKHSAFSFLFLGYRVPGDDVIVPGVARTPVASMQLSLSSAASGCSTGFGAEVSGKLTMLARRERTEVAKSPRGQAAAAGPGAAADAAVELTSNPVVVDRSASLFSLNNGSAEATDAAAAATSDATVLAAAAAPRAVRPDLTRSSFVHIVSGHGSGGTGSAGSTTRRIGRSIAQLSRRARSRSRSRGRSASPVTGAAGKHGCCASCSRKRASPLTAGGSAAVDSGAATAAGSSAAASAGHGKRRCTCQHPVDAVAACDSGNRAYWEATSLLRRALIVLLARLVPAALPQIAAFVVILTLFLTAHMLARPYRDPHFAFSEGASLLCVIMTAALAIIAQPSVEQLGGGIAATVLMLLINAATLGLLLRDWLVLCGPKHVATARDAASFARRQWHACLSCTCCSCCHSREPSAGAAGAARSPSRRHLSAAVPFAPRIKSRSALSSTPPTPPTALSSSSSMSPEPSPLLPAGATQVVTSGSGSSLGQSEWAAANPYHGRNPASALTAPMAAVSLQLAVSAATPSHAAMVARPRNFTRVTQLKPSAAAAVASSRRVAVQPRSLEARSPATR